MSPTPRGSTCCSYRRRNAPSGRNTTGCPSRAFGGILGGRGRRRIDDRAGGDLQPLGFEMPLHLGVLIGHPTQRDLTPPRKRPTYPLRGTDVFCERDRRFESVFLHRRVGVGVDPVWWTPFHLRRRCWDAEESPAIRAGISAPDGRAGAVGPNAGGAVTRVRANGASDLELGAPSRT